MSDEFSTRDAMNFSRGAIMVPSSVKLTPQELQVQLKSGFLNYPDADGIEYINTPGAILKYTYPPLEPVEGLKFDDGKPMLDLVPSSLVDAVGDILTMGAKKYSAQNWRKGLKYSRVIGALMRHLNAWREGDSIDKESGKSHMHHVACNVAFLIEFEANPEKYKDFDDRWIK